METQQYSAIHPYLMFNGNAREAMTFYQEIFGGELQFTNFSAAGGEVHEEFKDKVMHASLQNGHLVLMAGDAMMGEVAHGSTVQLSVNCSSMAEIEKSFAAIAIGGSVTMPLNDQFEGNRFGMVTDKFGFDWLFNYKHSA
jgi:PhnB protein